MQPGLSRQSRTRHRRARGGALTKADVVNVYGSDDGSGTGLGGLTLVGVVAGGSASREPGSPGQSAMVVTAPTPV
jgi:hypothetical protein